MLLLSHRGYHANAPENTLEAFEQAVAMGVDGIETDIRLSADGQAVLFHDRVSPHGREVASLSRQELSDAAGYRVPTVEEALAKLPGIFWNLEIKSRDAVEITKSIVNRVAPSTRLLITSFWHDVVEEFRRSTTVECGILIAQRSFADLGITHLLLDQKRIETIVWSFDVLDSDLIASAKQHGLRNFVYGAQTQKEHLQLMELRVDGIITDHPQFVLPK
jgi:glycerophosphoryl diester phosphodiesterase